MCKYKLGRRRPKWKVIKRSNAKIQAQATRGGKGAKEETNNLESHLEGEPNKLDNVFDAEPCHTRKIKLHD
jgi:hypothetical protein